jgi:hypothetical protein
MFFELSLRVPIVWGLLNVSTWKLAQAVDNGGEDDLSYSKVSVFL